VCLLLGISWYVLELLRVDAAQKSFVFHYTVYLGIDDVRPLAWLILWPALWLLTSMLFLIGAYGTYRRDFHAGVAWLVLASCSVLPWMLALHYLALINR
jgi:hypothetical protein